MTGIADILRQIIMLTSLFFPFIDLAESCNLNPIF